MSREPFCSNKACFSIAEILHTTLQQVYTASKSPRYEGGSNVHIHAATGGKTGLQNGGATCYLNAVIQVLTSISFLTQYFLCGEWMKDSRVDESLLWDVWFDVFIAAASQIFSIFHPRTFKMDKPMSAPAWFLMEAVCFDKFWNQHRYFAVVAGNMLRFSFFLVGHKTCTEHWFAIKLSRALSYLVNSLCVYISELQPHCPLAAVPLWRLWGG